MAKMDDIISKYSQAFRNGIITNENAKEIRKEMSKLASVANKRIERLKNAGLETSPAYKKWVEDGSVRFGVKGKNHNELQKELSRLKQFINYETSTIRGVNNTLKEMAANTGIKYNSLKDLQNKASKFFELASKVEQYLRNVDDIASAIGYQKIWEAINQYTAKANIELDTTENDVDSILEKVTQLITTSIGEPKVTTSNSGGWWLG